MKLILCLDLWLLLLLPLTLVLKRVSIEDRVTDVNLKILLEFM